MTGKRATLLLVLLVYSVLTILMTWPIAARLGTHVPGGTVDLWVHRWTFWWVKRSIVQGHSPFYTRLLYYPRGVSLAYQNIAWLNIGLWLPLQALLGSNVAYSLVFLAVLVLNGVSMHLLVKELLDSRPAAFIGGLIYGFWPYVLSHYGHPNMMVAFGVPLALLHVKRTLEEQRLRDALLAALFLALTGLARWQLLIMGAVVIVLYVIWMCARRNACRTRRALGLLALTGLVASAMMAPLASPVIMTYLNEDDPEQMLITEDTNGQTDLLAYVLPTQYHPLWCEASARIYESFVHNKVFVPFLGYTTLILAFCGVVRDWRRARFWLLTAVVYLALALGPQLRVNGQLHPGIPMPYRLVDELFFVRAVRNPDRFNVFLGLPIGVLASLAVADFTRARPLGTKSVLLVSVLGALISREYCLVPYHVERPVTPDWYRQLGQEPDEFAVLDLPMSPRTFDKQYMFYQTTHHKPLVEGHVSRSPPSAFGFMDGLDFLRGLRRENVMDPALTDVSHQLRRLAEADIRYVVLHKDFATREQLAAWRDWLTFEPLHEDEDLVVYTTDPQLNRDFTLASELTDDMGLLGTSSASTKAIQGAVIHLDARWGSTAPPDRGYDACLNLSDEGGEIAQSHCTRLSPSWPTSRWSAEEIVRSHHALQIPLTLEPGEYSLSLTVADSASGAALGEPAFVGLIRVHRLRPMHSLGVRLGEELLLRGYDLRQSDESLQLVPYWQAQRKMETSYKVFVHLVDPSTEEIVAQDDAVPRRWTYPTTRWQSSEVVADTILLSLDGVPPGRYHLRIGCYDPATGERLPVHGEDAELYPDGVVPLATIHH